MMFKHSDFEKESLGTSDPCSGTCSQIFGYLPVFASALGCPLSSIRKPGFSHSV